MDRKQQQQENQYSFPYHYVPQWGERFTQVHTMRWGYEYASYMEFVTTLLKDKYRPKKMIDVGCGDGRLVFEVSKHMPKVDVSGVDYSAQAISFAKAFNPKITFYTGDITDPSFSVGKYDTATLVETLEHIPPETIKKFVKGLHNLLDDRGHLIVTVPCSNVPVSKKHYQHFTLEHLKDTLSPYFVLKDSFYTNSTSFQVTIIKKLLHNRLFSLEINKLSNFLFNYYKKHLFRANKNTGRHVIGVFVKK